jgi:hypothetical protein
MNAQSALLRYAFMNDLQSMTIRKWHFAGVTCLCTADVVWPCDAARRAKILDGDGMWVRNLRSCVCMQDEDDDVVEERDPSGRFARYDHKVGKGRFKCVYKGFDEKQGIDIAWSKVLQVQLGNNRMLTACCYIETVCVHLPSNAAQPT